MRECPRCEICYPDDVVVCPDDDVNTKHTLPGPPLLSGRYLLEKRIGRGAMGQVYLARDQNLVTRRVAVKTVRPDILNDEDMQEGEAIARFEREARSAASIQHPNIVGVTDFGKSPEGAFFLVMEYVEGETLYQLLRREGTLNAKRAAVLLRQIVAGVEAAHVRNILHRDLKPANIFIMQQIRRSGAAAEGFVKVGDFGLAKIVHSDLSETVSGPASRGIVGTPEYMAPEQMREGFQLDVRADIYALGAIAYHMLGGRPPFTGNITQLVAQKLLETPSPLTALRSDISAEADQAVMQALAREPADRPATAGEWFEAFENAVAGELATPGESRVVIMAAAGSEVYVDDERYGSVGRSGRVILTSIPPGQHVLRVARLGEPDEERVIEIRQESAEQIIQTQLRDGPSSEHLTPSRGGSLASRTGKEPIAHAVVACSKCHARFAEGVNFCGKCANTTFEPVTANLISLAVSAAAAKETSDTITCPRCSQRYPSATRFCGRCGIPIGTPSLDWRAARPVEVICKDCGASYPAGAKFCGDCGKPFGP